MENKEKFYKIYELYNLFGKKNVKPIFYGAYKDYNLAHWFELSNWDLEKGKGNVKIEYGAITENDIKDLEKNGLKTGDKEGIEEVIRLIKKFNEKSKNDEEKIN